MLGPSLETFRIGAEVTNARIGLLISAGSIGYLFGSLLSGRLLQSLPAHRMMGGGLLLVAAAMVAITTVHSLAGLIVFQLLIGFGGAGVDVTGNTVVLWVHKGGPVMNALHLAFGLGGVLAPIVVSRSLSWTGGLRAGYWLVAAAIALVGTVILLRPSPPNPHEEGQRGFPPGKVLPISLAVGWFVSYAWMEVGFVSWIFKYGQARGLDPLRGAAWLGTGFLVAFSVGRLIAIPISSKVAPRTMMFADLVVCFIGLAVLLAGGGNVAAMGIGTALFGVGAASMFPSMLSLSEPVIPSTSSVTSSFLFGSSVGSIIFPSTIGALIDRNGPVAMPQTVLAGTVVAAIIVFAFDRVSRRA